MYYRINIADKNGQHYFATAEHSLQGFDKAQEVYKNLLQKFPPNEGWKLELTRWQHTGEVITRNGYGDN